MIVNDIDVTIYYFETLKPKQNFKYKGKEIFIKINVTQTRTEGG